MTRAPEGPPASRRDPDARRAAVLDAAQGLFTEQGVAATSIDAVAQRAGVAKGTVYLYYRSKDDLARALEERFTAGVVERVRAGAALGGAPLPEVVEGWCCALAEAYLDDVAVHDALFYGWAPPSREGTAASPLVDDLAQLLGARGVSDAGHRAAFLVGGVTSLVDRALLGEGFDRDDVVRAVRVLARAHPGL